MILIKCRVLFYIIETLLVKYVFYLRPNSQNYDANAFLLIPSLLTPVCLHANYFDCFINYSH